jgi:hypothetical protein
VVLVKGHYAGLTEKFALSGTQDTSLNTLNELCKKLGLAIAKATN